MSGRKHTENTEGATGALRPTRTAAGMGTRDAAVDDMVALALRQLAEMIEAGVPLERCMPVSRSLRSELHAVYQAVFLEVRDVLIQHRDFGSPDDRLRHRQGMILSEVP